MQVENRSRVPLVVALTTALLALTAPQPGGGQEPTRVSSDSLLHYETVKLTLHSASTMSFQGSVVEAQDDSLALMTSGGHRMDLAYGQIRRIQVKTGEGAPYRGLLLGSLIGAVGGGLGVYAWYAGKNDEWTGYTWGIQYGVPVGAAIGGIIGAITNRTPWRDVRVQP